MEGVKCKKWNVYPIWRFLWSINSFPRPLSPLAHSNKKPPQAPLIGGFGGLNQFTSKYLCLGKINTTASLHPTPFSSSLPPSLFPEFLPIFCWVDAVVLDLPSDNQKAGMYSTNAAVSVWMQFFLQNKQSSGSGINFTVSFLVVPITRRGYETPKIYHNRLFVPSSSFLVVLPQLEDKQVWRFTREAYY